MKKTLMLFAIFATTFTLHAGTTNTASVTVSPTAVVVDENSVVAEGITVTLSEIRDGKNFDNYDGVQAQKEALVAAKTARDANENVTTVSAVCAQEFQTTWAAAQWNTFAYHVIQANGDLTEAGKYLKVAQALLDKAADDGENKAQVQGWIDSNVKYVNTTHTENHATRHKAKKALKASAKEEADAEKASDVPESKTK